MAICTTKDQPRHEWSFTLDHVFYVSVVCAHKQWSRLVWLSLVFYICKLSAESYQVCKEVSFRAVNRLNGYELEVFVKNGLSRRTYTKRHEVFPDLLPPIKYMLCFPVRCRQTSLSVHSAKVCERRKNTHPKPFFWYCARCCEKEKQKRREKEEKKSFAKRFLDVFRSFLQGCLTVAFTKKEEREEAKQQTWKFALTGSRGNWSIYMALWVKGKINCGEKRKEEAKGKAKWANSIERPFLLPNLFEVFG